MRDFDVVSLLARLKTKGILVNQNRSSERREEVENLVLALWQSRPSDSSKAKSSFGFLHLIFHCWIWISTSSVRFFHWNPIPIFLSGFPFQLKFLRKERQAASAQSSGSDQAEVTDIKLKFSVSRRRFGSGFSFSD